MKTSVYLPDDLAEKAKKYNLSLSEIFQTHVRAAIRAIEDEEAEAIELIADVISNHQAMPFSSEAMNSIEVNVVAGLIVKMLLDENMLVLRKK